jgi:hypothetical protein
VSDHPGIDELADAASGALDPGRAREVEQHARGCEQCQDTVSDLRGVTELLRAEPTPSMPPEIAARLDAVLSQEALLRQPPARTGGSVPWPGAAPMTPPHVRHTLGTFGADLPKRSRRRLLTTALAACVAAGVVGFAGYFLSATAGLNEPTASAPAVVSSGQLRSQASSIQQRSNLSPHRFSQAWDCAREVTEGRITAITAAVVDGQPALLVYLDSDNATKVTVVTGCGSGHPVAGPSTILPR